MTGKIIAFLLLLLLFISAKAQDSNAPQLKQVLPKKLAASVLNRGDELRIRLKGKNFKRQGSEVLVNGQSLPAEKVIFQQGDLLAIIPASLIAAPGVVSFAVKVEGKLSNSLTMQVVEPDPSVTITAMQPEVVLAKGVVGDFGILLQGSNFDNKSKVRVGGFKTVSEVRRRGEFSIILGTVKEKEFAFATPVPVFVETGSGKLSNTVIMLVTPPAPDLIAVNPSSVEVNSPTDTFKLQGRDITPSTKVFVDGIEVPSRLKDKKNPDDLQTIEAEIAAGFFTRVRQLPVKLVNEYGDSDTLILNVRPAKEIPVIYSINPSHVPAGSNGFDLLINGDNFKNTKQVLVNGSKVEFTNLTENEQVNELVREVLKIRIKEKLVESPGQVSIQVVTKDTSSEVVNLIVEPPTLTTTVAGDIPGYRDGIGDKAWFANPSHAVMTPDGFIYIVDQANHAIRRFNPSNSEVVTVIGDPKGRPGFVDTAEVDKDNPNTLFVRFNNPIGIVADSKGTLYVSDFGNNAIRRIRFVKGQPVVDTIAGRSRIVKDENGNKERVGLAGFINNGPQLSQFSGPYGLALDGEGNLLVADSFNNVIRKITFGADGEVIDVSTAFGNGFPGLADGDSPSVKFNRPTHVLFKDGILYVSDFANNAIRKVDLANGSVSTLVGLRRSLQPRSLDQVEQGSPTYADGARFFAILRNPIASTLDLQGNLYFIDFDGDRIRRVSPEGVITTIAGGKRGYVDKPGNLSRFKDPRYLMMLDAKTILVVDSGNNRLRRVVLP
ncbi:MAG: hypothetical protein RMM17_02065 [Acidobacteriota bacterium]|nr:hypothetical protein [Blastocatellia bacterium]MDW8411456.1 hypothetical protein [Acidobacteriota bacterium]